MTAVQMGLTIAVCTAATMLTRFLPFVVFSSKEMCIRDSWSTPPPPPWA